MKRRRVIFISAAVGVIVLVAMVVWPRDREPEYQGKRLSYWLEARSRLLSQMGHGSFHDVDGYNNTLDAIRQIGTNGLPCLVEWLSYEPPRWRTWVRNCSTNLPRRIQYSRLCRWVIDDPNRARASRASVGLVVLDEQALAAIPELTQMQTKARDAETQLQISYTLKRLGVTNLPAATGY